MKRLKWITNPERLAGYAYKVFILEDHATYYAKTRSFSVRNVARDFARWYTNWVKHSEAGARTAEITHLPTGQVNIFQVII